MLSLLHMSLLRAALSLLGYIQSLFRFVLLNPGQVTLGTIISRDHGPGLCHKPLITHQPMMGSLFTEVSKNDMPGLSISENEQHFRYPKDHLGEEEVVITLPIFLPIYSTLSHSLEPIIMTHHIQWTVVIMNLTSHMSELCCSLSLHVLDHAVLHDMCIATHTTHVVSPSASMTCSHVMKSSNSGVILHTSSSASPMPASPFPPYPSQVCF